MMHENDMCETIGCLQDVRIFSFMKEIKLYIYIYKRFVFRLSLGQKKKIEIRDLQNSWIRPCFI